MEQNKILDTESSNINNSVEDIYVNPNISKENKESILSRLLLAQSLLEDSEYIPPPEKVEVNVNQKRHEREALVIYLLLTCFETLGRNNEYIPFENWINSKKSNHKKERDFILSQNQANNIIDTIKLLLDHHKSLYGVSNSFRNGIHTLNKNNKEILFSSINLGIVPNEAKINKNISYPTSTIGDIDKEIELKTNYLYKLRNEFTHSLKQQHVSSMPNQKIYLSGLIGENESGAWPIFIFDKNKVLFGSTHSEVRSSDIGDISYSINNWPFILFEVLHSEIGNKFDRTSIKLKYTIWNFMNDQEVGFLTCNSCDVSSVIKAIIGNE